MCFHSMARWQKDTIYSAYMLFILCTWRSSYAYDPAIFTELRGNVNAVVDAKTIDSDWEYNHNPNLEVYPDGEVLLAWSCGVAEGQNQKLCIARKTAANWQPLEVFDGWGNNVYIPKLVQPSKPGSPLYIYYALSHWCYGKSYVRKSTDRGRTWSDAIELPRLNDPAHDKSPTMHGGMVNDPLEIPPNSKSPYPAFTMLAAAAYAVSGSQTQGRIEVIPSNNYTSAASGGDLWSYYYMNQTNEGMAYDFFVLDPPDYLRLGMILRLTTSRGNTPVWISNDGGLTWSNTGQQVTGILPDCTPCAKDNISAGVTGESLDLNGGPLMGWHVAAGSGENQNTQLQGRDFIRVCASKDLQTWKAVLELKIGTGEHA